MTDEKRNATGPGPFRGERNAAKDLELFDHYVKIGLYRDHAAIVRYWINRAVTAEAKVQHFEIQKLEELIDAEAGE